jgi:hypothetical protein
MSKVPPDEKLPSKPLVDSLWGDRLKLHLAHPLSSIAVFSHTKHLDSNLQGRPLEFPLEDEIMSMTFSLLFIPGLYIPGYTEEYVPTKMVPFSRPPNQASEVRHTYTETFRYIWLRLECIQIHFTKQMTV